jgi:hypothetical protein
MKFREVRLVRAHNVGRPNVVTRTPNRFGIVCRKLCLPAVFGFAALWGCNSSTEPLPAGAALLDPAPDSYRTWWQEVEACSGRTGNFDAISWYYVPNVGVFPVGTNPNVDGYWQPYHHSITLAGFKIYDALLVRHEALHAILNTVDHPAEYFVQKCGSIVAPVTGSH